MAIASRPRALGRTAAAACLAALAALAAAPAPALAQSCPQGSSPRPPLCRNDFNIDLYQGPVLAPVRVTGMGGAFAAVAEGVDALGQNVAAAAVRTPYSTSLFDYDLSLGMYLPGAFGKTDFDNRGEVGLNAFTLFYTAGLLLQYGPVGLGAIADFQRYGLAAPEGSNLPGAAIEVGRLRVSAGYSFLGDQASIGAGVRGVRAVVDTLSPGSSARDVFLLTADNVLTMLGVSPEVGMLIRPDYAPFRVGVTYRLPVTASGEPSATVTRDSSGVRRAAGLALPERVHWPWELEAGVALSAGPRPLNPRFIDPRDHEARAREDLERQRRARLAAQQLELSQIPDPDARARREADFITAERYIRAEEDRRLERLSNQLEEERRARYQNWPRARILIVAEALITGPTDSGIGLQSFLRQEDVASGDRVSVQPRLGMEGEPVPDRLAARVGTYLEPSRYRLPPGPGVLSGSRQHFTFGLELRTVTWNVFGIFRPTPFTASFTGDLAPRYQNIGFSIGTWH